MISSGGAAERGRFLRQPIPGSWNRSPPAVLPAGLPLGTSLADGARAERASAGETAPAPLFPDEPFFVGFPGKPPGKPPRSRRSGRGFRRRRAPSALEPTASSDPARPRDGGERPGSLQPLLPRLLSPARWPWTCISNRSFGKEAGAGVWLPRRRRGRLRFAPGAQCSPPSESGPAAVDIGRFSVKHYRKGADPARPGLPLAHRRRA
ncbi:MAG: hypothetical protein Kow0092_10980 [Deferrisomatales bacterium]